MIVILEGVDKAGKSTLAARLRKKLGWPVTHFSRPGSDPATEYAEFLSCAILAKQDVICDRFFVGELVYGPLLRGKHSMTALQIVTIERMCRKLGAILVHVNPDYSVIKKRLHELGDTMVTPLQNKRAYEMFKEVCPPRRLGTYVRWYQDTSADQMAEQITNMIQERYQEYQDAVRDCTGIGTVVGSKFVFVGEAVNVRTSWMGLPFDNGPCSEYLLKAMLLSDVNESKVYMTNANTITHKEIAFLTSTGETRFISLGNKAFQQLNKMGITSWKIPHPQFWKRFHFTDVEKYAAVISEACKEAHIYNVNISVL